MEITKKQKLKILKNFGLISVFAPSIYFVGMAGVHIINLTSVEGLIFTNQFITELLLVQTGALVSLGGFIGLFYIWDFESKILDKVIEEEWD